LVFGAVEGKEKMEMVKESIYFPAAIRNLQDYNNFCGSVKVHSIRFNFLMVLSFIFYLFWKLILG